MYWKGYVLLGLKLVQKICKKNNKKEEKKEKEIDISSNGSLVRQVTKAMHALQQFVSKKPTKADQAALIEALKQEIKSNLPLACKLYRLNRQTNVEKEELLAIAQKVKNIELIT